MGEYETCQKEVLEASLWLSENGFFGSLRGTGGNVSVRTEGKDVMAVTPSSVKYQEITPADICIVDLSGNLVEGDRAPSIEAGMHAAVYRERPDVKAVVHTHQTYGSVFALINQSVPALFDEVAFALGENIEVIPYALSGSPELAANVGNAVRNKANAYIIKNHGIIALGKNMDKALLATELLEKAAKTYCIALSTGIPIGGLPDDVLEMARGLREYEAAEAKKKD